MVKISDMKNIFWVLLFLLISSNVKSQVDSSFTLKCNGECKYSDNNKTYQPYNQFLFELETDAEFGEFNWVKSTGRKLYLRLSIMPRCFFKQSEIIYEYLLDDSVFSIEKTGLIDDKREVWIHPPRSVIYEVQYSFYYNIKFKKEKWRGGKFQMTHFNPYDSTRSWVIGKEKYSVANDTSILFNNKEVVCRKVAIASTYYGKSSNSYMLFNEKYGFMYIDARFVNGRFYTLKLVDYIADYCNNDTLK